MDKDEILERSRKEHKDRDFVEMEALSNVSAIALSVGVVLCGLLSALHLIFKETVDCGAWTVMFGILSTVMLMKYAKLRRRHELVLGLFYLISAVAFFVVYLRKVLEVF